MATAEKVRYLKFDRGRYYYQRRIPREFKDVIGRDFWRSPCGDVSFAEAVAKVVALANEHDRLLEDLKSPDERQKLKTENRRIRELKDQQKQIVEDQAYRRWLEDNGEEDPGYFGEDEASRAFAEVDRKFPWRQAMDILEALEAERKVGQPTQEDIEDLRRELRLVEKRNLPLTLAELPPYPEFMEVVLEFEGSRVVKDLKFSDHVPEPMDDDEYHDWLTSIYERAFGDDDDPPQDPDQRDDYDFAKRRLERKIAEVAPEPNTLSKVAEKYYAFNDVRPSTVEKYRRNLGLLIEHVGDVPIHHVLPGDLRKLRDKLSARMLPASVHAMFTPIKGLFSYAIEDDLVDVNPMSGVKLPKDKRPIEDRRWLSFSPEEMTQILQGVDQIWMNPVQSLSEQRRDAVRMVVRVLSFTAMRPIEVLRLVPEDVDDRAIRIRGSKTESSNRIIPLHPEIKDFPSWLAAGGLDTFRSIQTDVVAPVRHNFARLIRRKLDRPIINERKALYSLRSTFENAMRRAGADKDMRRAILGHKEAGALRHYDDGPEFELKKDCIERTDPRRPYQPKDQK